MRIKIEGKWEMEPLSNQIKKVLTEILEKYPVKYVSGINLYFNPYNYDKKRFEIVDSDGEQLSFLIKKPKEKKKTKLKIIQGGLK